MEIGTGGTTHPEGHRARESTKPKIKATEKREPSQTRPKINVKDIGIIIYFKRSSRYIIDNDNQERREILYEAIMRGETKIQWKHPNFTYEAIFNGIVTKFIKLEDLSICKVADNEFAKIKNKCINP